MTRTLLLMRHAKSSWNDTALDDHDRPLNARGKRDAPRIGELLCREGLVPDAIISSSAKRAQSTARRVAEAAGYTTGIATARALYLATPEEILAQLREHNPFAACVLLIGHNPGMEQLLECLTGHREPFPTAALAQLQLDIGEWKTLQRGVACQLVRFWRPREL